MKIAISGASGFVGSNLLKKLNEKGFQVIVISRKDLLNTPADLVHKINGIQCIVNLSGASISKRWTRKHKRDIYTSRIGTTRKLVDAIKLCETRPEIFINASAIGIYDSKHAHHEESRFLAGDYLSKVIRDWEHAAKIAMEYGVETSILRFGVILGKGGGMMKKVLPVFKMGLGGNIGNGSQKFSFIHLDDLLNVIISIIERNLDHGIYNLVAPETNTNESFTKVLASVLHKKAFMDIPVWVIKMMYGAGATVITGGQQVIPGRLQENGYLFLYPDLRTALKEITGK